MFTEMLVKLALSGSMALTAMPAAAFLAPAAAGPTVILPSLKTGWNHLKDGWKYVYSDGTPASSCWEYLNGHWYHFTQEGLMQTGWYQEDSIWYYLKPDGAMATGWVCSGKTWYYMDNNGAMETGWLKLTKNGKPVWYYLDHTGAMKKGWLKLEWNGKKDWYYFQQDGSMLANGNLGKYRFDGTGKCLNPLA